MTPTSSTPTACATCSSGVAQAGLVQAKWTDKILDKTFDNLKQKRPDLDPVKLDRTRLAAAIKANAQLIVTENTQDFPPAKLSAWSIEARNADDFVLDLIELNQQAVYAQVQRMADARQNPPGTVEDVLDSLERVGMLGSVAALRR